MKNISRPALRYHGGKWRLAPWIISYFPDHDSYIEPFGGAMSVLLQKTPSKIETYNDLNGLVVNFFRVLREQPDELIRAITLTPYSRNEFILAQQPAGDPLEDARRFFVWSWQGRGRAGVLEPGGWRFMVRNTRGLTPVDDWVNIDHLWAIVNRLKNVQLENDDAFRIIKRFDDPRALFYIDPPYVSHTRSNRWGTSAYLHEFSEEQHIELSTLLHSTKGAIIISGYPSKLYESLYANWIRLERNGSVDRGRKGGKSITEVLWVNKMTTLPLFTKEPP